MLPIIWCDTQGPPFRLLRIKVSNAWHWVHLHCTEVHHYRSVYSLIFSSWSKIKFLHQAVYYKLINLLFGVWFIMLAPNPLYLNLLFWSILFANFLDVRELWYDHFSHFTIKCNAIKSLLLSLISFFFFFFFFF